ncbi:MAG: CD225/dispanin family protein [Pseudomonadota bacterium]|nr:CD225/dispanin family protein [Pseudomonadota bacterium]
MNSSAKIPNNLVWAILSTLFCCLPLGIVSIVHAAKVDGLVAAGDYAAAQQASDNAKKWAMISAGVGIVLGLIYLILAVLGAFAGAADI